MADVTSEIHHVFFYVVLSLHFLCCVDSQYFQSQELAILLRLKEYWRDPPLLDHWTSSSDSNNLPRHCSWNGVICQDGSVTGLKLGFKNLNRGIPPFLCDLKNLTILDLHGNVIPGEIPEAIGNLQTLEHLDLSLNSLSGKIPGNIGRLPNLKDIKLSKNNFSGTLPSDLGRYSALKTFEIFSNRFIGALPENLCFRGKLIEVVAYDNYLVGKLPESFGSCGTLSVLRISNNKFSGTIPEGLGGCNNLSVLSVSTNDFSGKIPEGLGRCNRLLRVSLSENWFSGRIPEELWRSSSLYLLLLNDNQFEGELPSDLPGNLSRVELNNNKLSGEIPRGFSFWKNLTFFEARNNFLTGTIPEHIASWKSLKRLDLSRNRLSGPIPGEIGSVSGLEQLDLSENQLSGEIPSQLGRLRLDFLNLSFNHLTGRIPLEFKNPIYASSFLNNSGLCAVNPSPILLSPCNSRSKNKILIAISVVLGTSLLVALVIIYVLVVKVNKREMKLLSNSTSKWKFTQFRIDGYSEADILSGLTDHNIVGGGGSGKVYRIPVKCSGNFVAAKRIWNNGKLGHMLEKEFIAEVGVLSKIRHENIVTLLGCVSSESSKILIYEYLENRSLDKWLHRKKGESFQYGIEVPLDWSKRLKIAIGAAQGLCYMHHYCSPPIIHRDVKSSNILLDAEFNGKVADFGLARLLMKPGDGESVSVVAGTFGYIAPEYARTKRINEKSDIYSFGVVLLELTTGRVANDMNEDICLAEWAHRHFLDCKQIPDALDREIKEPYNLDEMCFIFNLGIRCTMILPSARPSMEEVLQSLLRCIHKPYLNM